jgi:hypothetical protein
MRTLESFEPLLDEDVRALRTEVFKMDTFFVTDVDKTPLAVAYMGTLRKSSEEVFKDVEKRLQGMEGAFGVGWCGLSGHHFISPPRPTNQPTNQPTQSDQSTP